MEKKGGLNTALFCFQKNKKGGQFMDVWEGFILIPEKEAVARFLHDQEVFGLDDEGYEALIESKDGFKAFDRFVIEK